MTQRYKRTIKSGTCPVCGSEAVIESITSFGVTKRVRRCNGLIELHEDEPLEACHWSEELPKDKNQ